MEDQQAPIRDRFKKFILEDDHPCIMSRTMFELDTFQMKSYAKADGEETTRQLYRDLAAYVDGYDFDSTEFYSFIAVFPGLSPLSEKEFEAFLWDQLQRLHLVDEKPWDPTVNDDPQAHDFSFSLLGKAFYIVGMHPNSSRAARQSPYPCLVFNLHWQFEQLREMGTYERIRDTIRQRDKERNGSVNPMLADFGKGNEAAQYSGRKVPPTWKCPFQHKKRNAS